MGSRYYPWWGQVGLGWCFDVNRAGANPTYDQFDAPLRHVEAMRHRACAQQHHLGDVGCVRRVDREVAAVVDRDWRSADSRTQHVKVVGEEALVCSIDSRGIRVRGSAAPENASVLEQKER